MDQRKGALEDMVITPPFDDVYRGKTVLLTGHTGFKGGWLATWLKALGARVVGYALPPEDTPNLYEAAGVDDGMVSIMGDVRDDAALRKAFTTYEPDFVFHLAAQPLVRRSFDAPVETFEVNIMGTVNVLEAVRKTPSVRAAVVITTDKCYENREWVYAYRENDPLGGHDPYSASKAGAEIVVASYRQSFFHPDRSDGNPVGIASARAGNVIGGGDWSVDRLLPDCIRALAAGQRIPIRNPHAIRPWQHVLEPLAGYLWLGACLWNDPVRYGGAWNFGPDAEGHIPVRRVVELVTEAWGEGGWDDLSARQAHAPHEAHTLKLDCTKAASLLAWRSVFRLEESVHATVDWYRRHRFERSFDGAACTREQIDAYVHDARHAGLRWTTTPSGKAAHAEATLPEIS